MAAKAVLIRMIEMFSTGNIGAIQEVVADTYRDHQGLHDSEIRGATGFADIVAAARRACNTLDVRPVDLIAEGDLAVARIRWHGVLLTGEIVDRETIEMIRVVNGKAVEHWGAETTGQNLALGSDVVTVVPYRSDWPEEFANLKLRLKTACGNLALHVDHIGSTSIPGMPAKDVIDIQIVVTSLDETSITEVLSAAAFERRPGDWNLRDHVPEGWNGDPSGWDKLVFSPRPGIRLCNVHVRVAGRANERYALLFREYLRANERAMRSWAEFKIRLAAVVPDLTAYGQVKDPATDVLMESAERWAEATGWRPRAT
jgi:dephospho-CoA kinase